jgi:hypothetical protein
MKLAPVIGQLSAPGKSVASCCVVLRPLAIAAAAAAANVSLPARTNAPLRLRRATSLR